MLCWMYWVFAGLGVSDVCEVFRGSITCMLLLFVVVHSTGEMIESLL